MPAILAATALGALTGYLIGLSTSPVVGAVLSGLLAMAAGVAALTGVQNPFLPKGESAAARTRMHNLAVAGFALAALAGVSAGLLVRSHNLLSPSPSELKAEWQALGFDEDTSARIALASLTGITLEAEGAPALAQGEGGAMASLLFATAGSAACQRTDPARMRDPQAALDAWSRAPAPWPRFAEAMEGAGMDRLEILWAAVCEEVGE